MSNHTVQEVVANLAKDAPPVTVGTLMLFGIPLSDLVLILTFVYTLVRIVSEVRSWTVRKTDDSDTTVLANRNTDSTNK